MRLVVLLCVLCAFSEGARILVCVPTPSISHQVVFFPLINELLKRHHEVVFITTDAMYPKGMSATNLTEIDTHDASYKLWEDLVLTTKSTTGRKEDQNNQVKNVFTTVRHSFEVQVMTPEVQDLIKNKSHFDLLIIEACAKSALALSHIFKAPLILISSFGSVQDNYDLIGAPKYPRLLYPYCMHQKVNNMGILDRIRVNWDAYNLDLMFAGLKIEENRLVKKLFGPDTPTLEEMGDNVDMLFLNVYSIWEMNRPVPPGVIFIGGIHETPKRDLPKDLQAYLDSSERGVVYFSLGTNAKPSTLSAAKIRSITNALGRLKYDVLIKWDHDELPGKGNNTKVAKWLPQADVLRHPSIKAFVTQGGLQSFDEAMTGGVPFVGIPMLGDQWYNVEVYEYLKIGVGLLMEELTEDKLVNAINTVIDNPSYRHNLINLREKLRDQPQSALDRAVYWTEHVIRHKGGKHLRSPIANMSWSEYLDLELLAVAVLAALAALAAAITVLYYTTKLIRRLLFMSIKLKDA